MDRIDPCRHGNADDLVDRKVGFKRAELQFAHSAPPDPIRLVGLESVQREFVLFRIDGDGLEAEFGCGAKYPNCDLAAIGDENTPDRR